MNTASGNWATVPGGIQNSARGSGSFVAGHDAKAIHDGAFVWNDRSVITGNDSLLSTGPNQFLIRAAGGVGIGTNNPGRHDVAINGASTGIAGATLEVENFSTGSGIAAHFETNGTDATLVIDQDGTGNHIKTFDNSHLRFRVADKGNVTAGGTFVGGGQTWPRWSTFMETPRPTSPATCSLCLSRKTALFKRAGCPTRHRSQESTPRNLGSC